MYPREGALADSEVVVEAGARGATIVLQPDGVRIAGGLTDLASFRRSAVSRDFPEKGRVVWFAGEVEVGISPANLNFQGSCKAAIARAPGALVEDTNHGTVFVDATRLTALGANLSPKSGDVAVFFRSCVSDSSQGKDYEPLRERYVRAGIPEDWMLDARGASSMLMVLRPRLVRLAPRPGVVRYRLERRPA